MSRPTAIFIILLLLSPCIPAAGDWQTLQNTATSLYQQGDYAQAAVYLKQAITRAEQADNGDKYKVSSLNLLAFVYLATGDQQRALATLAQAIIIARKVYPNSHPTLAIMLFNTGDFLEQAGQAEQALHAYQEAWAIQRQDVVKYADAALKTADALVAIHNSQQRYQRSVAIATTILTPYTNTKPTAFNESLRQISYALAQAQLQLHHRELAQQALAQQLRRDQATLTAFDSRIADTLERLAASFDGQNPQAALPLREQAMQIRNHNNTPTLTNVMNLNEVALDKLAAGLLPQARTLYHRALAILKQLHLEHSIEQALILGNLASVEDGLKDKDKALELYLASLKLHQQFPQQPQQAANIAGRAAAIYYGRRKYAEAEPLFLQSFELLETSEAAIAALKVALENLINVYDVLGKQQQKKIYIEKLLALDADNPR